MANIKYSKELCNKICEYLESGKSLTEICNMDDINITTKTIGRWRKKYKKFNESFEESYKIFIQTKQEQLIELLKSKLPTPKEIAKMYDIDPDDKLMIKHYLNGYIKQVTQEINTLKFIIGTVLPRVSPQDKDSIKLEHTGNSSPSFVINVREFSNSKKDDNKNE
jgi:transposase-like protein